MIVVFGSINLDLVARVRELPAAGKTIAAHAFATSPGGKGANQALAARRAGARVALFGAIGRDAFAAPALALIRASGIVSDGIEVTDAPTGIALIHVDDVGENAITLVAGANAYASSQRVDEALLGPTTTILLQFETPAEQSLALAMRAKPRGSRVVLNCAPARALDDAWLASIDVLVVNAGEAEVVASASKLPSAPHAFAEAIAQRYGIDTVVTLGGDGIVAATRTASYKLPAAAVDVVDTVGAGDAFVGVLAATLDRAQGFDAALIAATAAASLACTREGAQASLPDAAAITSIAKSLASRMEITRGA